MTDEPRDYEAAVDRAMADCWTCQKLTPEQREEHKTTVLRQILAKQTIPPHTFPDSVWQHGRPGTAKHATWQRRERA